MIMIRLKFISHSTSKIQREHVSAWIYSYLSKQYHDEGLAKFNNGQGVKAHNFSFPSNKIIKNGEVFIIEIRGLQFIEDVLFDRIELYKNIKLGNMEAVVIYKEMLPTPIKSKFVLKSPAIVRLSAKRELNFKRWGNKYYYLTPFEDKEMWEQEIVTKLKRRIALIFNQDENELPDFKVEINQMSISSPVLHVNDHTLKMRATRGIIEVEGDDFWKDIVFRMGIGEFNAYGFGILDGMKGR